jgi:type II secretory pathway pseudopilin PulG
MRIGRAACGGFAYLFLLLVVALLAMAAAASVGIGAAMARRDAEQQLLAVGMEFEAALRSYSGAPANAAMPAVAQGPRALEDLLKDPRVPGLRRHLRQIYADPLTGKQEWGLIKDPGGFILGVYSLADGQPLQRTGFAPQLGNFTDAEDYRSWVFGLPVVQAARTNAAAH